MARKSRPSSAPPKTHAKATQPIAIGLRIYLPPAARDIPFASSFTSASVREFQRYEAGNRDGEEELPKDRLQIGQTAREWVDCNDVPVPRSGQRREAEIQHGPDFFRAAYWGNNIDEGARAQLPNQAKAEAKIVATVR